MSKPGHKQTVLITGASGGMGKACALLAASRGFRLLLSDIDAQGLEQVAGECSTIGAAVECFSLDITDSEAVADFVQTLASGVPINAVIHTVGLSPQMAPAEKIISVDLVCTVRFLETVRPLITPGGCAVCVASMSAHMIPPNPEVDKLMARPLESDLVQKLRELPGDLLANPGFAYAYAKKGLLHYVQAKAAEWGREGKRLTSISPGLIDTPMGQLEESGDRDGYASMRKLIGLQRDGNPDEIAGAALFLVSEDASYVTGCDLLVDGGFVAAFKNLNPDAPTRA